MTSNAAAIAAPVDTDVAQDDAPSLAQIRVKELARQARESGKMDDSSVTPQYLARLALVVKNMTVPGSMSVRPTKAKEAAARKEAGETAFPFVFTRYMTPEQEDAWKELVGKSQSIHKARAAAALALGFTAQDAGDLAFIAEAKGKSIARENLLAWLREFKKLAPAD